MRRPAPRRTESAPGHAALAQAVGENIEGGRVASSFLWDLRSATPDPDALLRSLLEAQQASPARLRGFCRRLQKALERAAAGAPDGERR